ncbi:Mbov_0399 family ICE element protein [Metamycoplasma hyosynoviae]|uniref:Mbov_0399 family ICE element protein n=1 Tax=Metamycoplasma hyosynoviae TaxID=29559 RepID=UPI002358660E|nr:hypothetical protein [Metamycoplasma hyosynoviae]MDC8914656.1 hypothetical protein [Metamycoplasma hyosynoviae]
MKSKKILFIAGGIFSIASASLFSLSLAKTKNSNDYYEQNNKYSFLNNQKLLESLFTNLNFNRNDIQNNFEFNNEINGNNNPYKDQKFINGNSWYPNFEIEAKSLDETYNRNPFGDFEVSSYTYARTKDELNLPIKYQKYVNNISYSSEDCMIDPWTGLETNVCSTTPGDIYQTIKKENYFLHWINRYKFSSLTKDYDIEIHKFNNKISFSDRNSWNKFTDKKAKLETKIKTDNAETYIYNRFFLQCSDKIDVNFSLKKWNQLDLDDAYSLIKYFTKNNSFNHLKTFLETFKLKNTNQRIIIDSDTMGDLSTPIDTNVFIGGKSNIDKLKDMVANLEKVVEFDNFKVKYGYDVIVNPDAKSFNLVFKVKQIFYKDKDITKTFKEAIAKEVKGWIKRKGKMNNWSFSNNFQSPENKEKSRKLYQMFYEVLFDEQNVINNIPVAFKASSIYDTYGEKGFKSRLFFKYGKVINQRSLHDIQKDPNFDITKQVETDKPIKLEEPNGNYGGKWLINSPLQVEFIANREESEVLFINGQKIDVLNRHFKYHLKDLRTSANDEEKIALDEKDKNKTQNELNDNNSRKKNEYIIEIKKYKSGSNNSGQPISTYKIKFLIVEQNLNQSLKWFAWNPEINPEQKELITPELTKDGKTLTDKDGNPLTNPKYDESIDPNTGTKKQILWIPKSTLNKKITEKLKFWYPKIDILNDYGIFAEASVLGKGALRNLIVDKNIIKNSNVKYYKCKIYDKQTNKWLKNDELEMQELSPENGNSQNAYMSEEGVWLIAASSNGSISNIKLVIIDENNTPKNYFLDELKNKFDNNGIELVRKFELFWNSTLGVYFKNWLINERHYEEARINKISYDALLPLYNEYVNGSWEFYNPNEIDKTIDIFNDFKWSKLNNLNGLTNQKAIKEFVLNYIRKNIAFNKLTKNLMENKDWFISEFTNINDENKFLQALANVSIYGTNENNNYEGVKLTLIGKGLYANSKKEIYFRNEAWHIYNPPIDLSKIDIQDNLTFNISKQTFEGKNIPEEVADENYRKAIENKVLNFINFQLLEYKNKTKQNGKEIEMILDKDLEIDNFNEVIAHLMRGKVLDKSIELKLIGKNANLYNYKTINFKNLGDGGKFNLKNLSYVLMDNKNIIKETNPSKIKEKVIELVKEAANKLALQIDKDYKIFAINNDAYWLELVSKYDDPKLKENKEFYDKLVKALEELKKRKTFKYQDKDVPIEFESKDLNIKNQLEHYKNLIIEELLREINNNGLNEQVLSKKVILLPTNTTKGFGYGYIINRVDKAYNPSKDPEWKPNPNPSEDDDIINPSNKPNKDKGFKKIAKTWWFPLVMVISIIGLLVGGIFLTKTLLRKYGWSFGKRARRNKNKKYEKAIAKRKKFLEKEHIKNQKELEKKYT